MKHANALQTAEVHPDKECAADDIRVRHEPPITAVSAVIAIVAHHEIVARRHFSNDALSVVVAVIAERVIVGADNERRHLRVIQDRVLAAVEIFFELLRITNAFIVEEIRQRCFRNRLAVDGQLLVLIRNSVAGKADHALDVIHRLVFRIAKHDYVTALERRAAGQLGIADRQTQAVLEFIDEDEIAHQERWHHGTRWNLERFDYERAYYEHHQDHRKEARGILQVPRLAELFIAQASARLRRIFVGETSL